MVTNENVEEKVLSEEEKHKSKCRNLPFDGRATRGLTGASSMGGKCTESPPMFIRGKRRKNRKGVVYEL